MIKIQATNYKIEIGNLVESSFQNLLNDKYISSKKVLSEYKIGRNDVIINLGGGVVSDMGGFIASIYKRGIDFINIPTSLLAMVDASIGGKTGIDLGRHKNQLGTFTDPKALFVDISFLET